MVAITGTTIDTVEFVISHICMILFIAVIFLYHTTGVIPSPTQIIVMPDDSSNPYWNSSCVDCAV